MPMMLSHDTSIDYDIQGDGPFLLLINGLGFGRWAWFKQVPALSRHFRTSPSTSGANTACRAA